MRLRPRNTIIYGAKLRSRRQLTYTITHDVSYVSVFRQDKGIQGSQTKYKNEKEEKKLDKKTVEKKQHINASSVEEKLGKRKKHRNNLKTSNNCKNS